jgi:hypothetical protein
MASQYASPHKPMQEPPTIILRSSTPTKGGQLADSVATAAPIFGGVSEESFVGSTSAGFDAVEASPAAVPDGFARKTDAVDTTTTTTGAATFAPSNSSTAASIQSKVSFMFGILSSTDAVPQVDGYLTRTDQIVRNVVMDNPNAFQSIASSVLYPVTRSIEKDHCRLSSYGRTKYFFDILHVWHVSYCSLSFLSLSFFLLFSTVRRTSIYGNCLYSVYCIGW